MGGAATDRWGVPVHAGGDRGVALLDDAVEALVALAGTRPPTGGRGRRRRRPGAGRDRGGLPRPLRRLPRGGGDGPSAPRAPRRLAAPPRGVPPPGGPGLGRRRLGRALGALEQALVRHPRDLLALKIAQDLYFATGQSPAFRDVAGRVLAAWPVGHPGWGYVQGMYAFGLEENGQYREAEEPGPGGTGPRPRATSGPPTPWPMSSRWRAGAAGVDFLRSSAPDWRSSFFAVHNWWHRALYHLELGQIDEVLALYDGPIRGAGSN